MTPEGAPWNNTDSHYIPSTQGAHTSTKERPDRDLVHHQSLITCFFYHAVPLCNILAQSIHKFLSNVANRQTNATSVHGYLHAFLLVKHIGVLKLRSEGHACSP